MIRKSLVSPGDALRYCYSAAAAAAAAKFIIGRNAKFQLAIRGNKDVIFLPSNTYPLLYKGVSKGYKE